jgi:hypothetical protein
MSVGFKSDDIDANIALIEQLMSGATQDFGNRAMRAGQEVEKAVHNVIKSRVGDPAASIGIAFAVHKVAKMLIEGDRKAEEQDRGVIQLLS